MVKNNHSAQSFFETRSGIFVFLVVMTGGVYPALCLVSSNIFGLGMFSSGITRFELRKMQSIKVFGTVVLENLPQLIFQCLFVAAIGGLTDSLTFAFFTSVLSIISSILRLTIDRSNNGMQSVQYYVFTEQSQGNDLTSEQKKRILAQKGKRRYLAISIARIFGIRINDIEVGTSTLTQNGLFTHIVQSIDCSELLSLSSKEYLSNKLMGEKNEITELFKRHFGLKTRVECDCEFYLDPHKKIQIGCVYNADLQSDIANLLNSNAQQIGERHLKNRIMRTLRKVLEDAVLSSSEDIESPVSDSTNGIELAMMNQTKKRQNIGIEYLSESEESAHL